ncbi:MAG: FG-GAP repeat domain-containing protein [Verrucomicrobiaceae bacterium]
MKKWLRLSLISVICTPLVSPGQDYTIAWEQATPGTSAFDVSLGDIDNDNDQDAVICHLTGGSVLLTNNGNGIFTLVSDANLPSAGAVEFGDLNGDNHPDLFFAVHLGSCKVWLNDGSGNFTDSGQSIGANESRRSLELVDIDNDNDLDAVVPTNSSSGTNKIWLNDGNGVFTDSGQDLGSNFAQGVAVGDVDADDDPDIILCINGRNKIWLNNGSGSFTESGVTFSVSTTFDAALADLDGDDDLDLYFANGNNSDSLRPNEVWLNDGSGGFTDSGQDLGLEYSFSVHLHDFDGDGDLDALEGNHSGQINHIRYNDGDGNFSDSGLQMSRDSVSGIASADLDGDNDLDFFLAVNGGPSTVWLSVPAPTLISDTLQRLGGSRADAVAHGDLDGDGDLDAAVGNTGGLVRILINDGTGQLSQPGDPLPNGFGNNNGDLALGDFDGDNDLDLIVVNNEQGSTADQQNRIWINDGSGNFSLGTTFPDQLPSNAVAVADLDGDDDLDFIVGNAMYSFYTGQNQIFINNGGGSFTATDGLGQDHAQDIILAHFNNDTHLDAFIVSFNGANKVWLGNGDATFTDTGQSLASRKTTSVATADFDADGDLDVVCGNDRQSNIIWLNDGSGNFTESGASLGSGSTRSVAVVDRNGDNHPDIWIGNGVNGPEADFIYQNDGAGNFTLAQTIDSRTTPDLTVADFTGDGMDNVLTVSAEGDHALWTLPQPTVDPAAYAASFGLNGPDTAPEADPDGDGLPNFLEMAFNLNPTVADADIESSSATSISGVPALRVALNGPNKFINALVIRRLNTPNLNYTLNVSSNLLNFSAAPGVIVMTQPIDTNYERATYRFTVPAGSPAYYGRFEVSYTP